MATPRGVCKKELKQMAALPNIGEVVSLLYERHY